MKPQEIRAIMEALLFVAEGPVESSTLAAVLPEEVREGVEEALEDLRKDSEGEGRGVQLVRVAGGWRLQTRPELYTWVSEFLKVRRKERLSRQALETLAVVTYRQPATAPEIAEIRGVDPTASLRTLLDRGLIRIAGRKKVVGKPFLYGTTGLFLEEFGLDSLDDLPDLKEFEDLLEEKYQAPQQELFEGSEPQGEETAEAPAGTAGQGEGGQEDSQTDTDTLEEPPPAAPSAAPDPQGEETAEALTGCAGQGEGGQDHDKEEDPPRPPSEA